MNEVRRLSADAQAAVDSEDYQQVSHGVTCINATMYQCCAWALHVLQFCRNLQANTALYSTNECFFAQALKIYSQITHMYPDLAIVQYAKVKHALMLYQSGKMIDAVLEMEGQEEEMRGNAEVHAALAAMLYSETPRQINRAETQWEIAREFDKRYGNVDWVKQEKQWPPAMQAALRSFLTLT